MGGRPVEALALIGLGIHRLSITPAAIGPIKSMVRSLEMKPLQAQMGMWMSEPARFSRAVLCDYAVELGIAIALPVKRVVARTSVVEGKSVSVRVDLGGS